MVTRQCYVCLESGHSFTNCPAFSYRPDQKTVLDYLTDINQRRNSPNIRRMRASHQGHAEKVHVWRVAAAHRNQPEDDESRWSNQEEESSNDSR